MLSEMIRFGRVTERRKQHRPKATAIKEEVVELYGAMDDITYDGTFPNKLRTRGVYLGAGGECPNQTNPSGILSSHSTGGRLRPNVGRRLGPAIRMFDLSTEGYEWMRLACIAALRMRFTNAKL